MWLLLTSNFSELLTSKPKSGSSCGPSLCTCTLSTLALLREKYTSLSRRKARAKDTQHHKIPGSRDPGKQHHASEYYLLWYVRFGACGSKARLLGGEFGIFLFYSPQLCGVGCLLRALSSSGGQCLVYSHNSQRNISHFSSKDQREDPEKERRA